MTLCQNSEAAGLGRRGSAPGETSSANREEALQTLDKAQLPQFSGPYRFALTFQDMAQARNAALLPGAEILANGLSVQVRANDFEEGYLLSRRMIALAGVVGRGDAYWAVLNKQPEGANLRVAVADWLYDRFLDRFPETLPSPPPTRYWGAR